ncbi:hypothetical protein [Orbus wheelerorum]
MADDDIASNIMLLRELSQYFTRSFGFSGFAVEWALVMLIKHW